MSELLVQSDTAVVGPHDLDTIDLPERHAPLTVRSFGLTDVGKVRKTNEDQFLIASLVKALQVQQTSLPQPPLQHSRDQSFLFVVADGMGGMAAGEQASALAVGSVESFVLETFKWFSQCKSDHQDHVWQAFQNALGQAHDRVRFEASEHPEWKGMATTLTLAFSHNDELFVAHAGDSRCYHFRDGALYRLTSDHTLVEDLLRRGALSEDQAATHAWRHIVTNAVGCDSSKIKVELHKLRLQTDDVLLLCSDGLTRMVSEEKIAAILYRCADPEQACRQLVVEANAQGGQDNITVIVADFDAAETKKG
jgi:PPM family protein phosphatase